MASPLRVAIAGLGTVGAGTIRVLQDNADILAARAGRPIDVVAVSARDRNRDRGVDLTSYEWHDDPVAMAAAADVDVVVELIGGSDGPAKAMCEAALKAGRHVVTANKALLAVHGMALAELAENAGVALQYEAAVAGGIPIIKALREGLLANRLSRVYGILNGTCNYILSDMRESGREFAAVLKEAQELGYAEADPSTDVDGIDAAHKLAILASAAFGRPVDLPSVHIEGIRHVTPLDIQFAAELGYRIKLLGIARLTDSGVEQRVHPCLVPIDAPIAHVEGVYNAVVTEGDFVDKTVYEGRGAGAGPTASAVVADIADIARGAIRPVFGIPAAALANTPAAPMERHVGAYFVRLMVIDRHGVIADITRALADAQVSLEQVLQKAGSYVPEAVVPVVLVTHETDESSMNAVLPRIAALETVVEPPRMIRIEPF